MKSSNYLDETTPSVNQPNSADTVVQTLITICEPEFQL